MAKPYSDMEKEFIARWRHRGASYAKIARVLDRTESGVAEYCRKAGLAKTSPRFARDCIRDHGAIDAVRRLCEEGGYTTRQVVDAATCLGTEIIIGAGQDGLSVAEIASLPAISHSRRTIRDILQNARLIRESD